ncbi:MAG: Hsp20/alpha crystallin family protein [Flavobacteriales bacterium]|nr:Hsp20/alpha crystallin family protein [Flavobacteriales bacterium]
MTLVKYNNRLNPLDNLFSDLFDNSFFRPFSERREFGNSIPSANVREDEDQYFIDMAIPGFEKNDLNIDLNENILTVSSEQSSENTVEEYKMREFNYSSFKRSFKLPKEIDANKINASYKAGVLSVNIPKMHKDDSTLKKTIKIS